MTGRALLVSVLVLTVAATLEAQAPKPKPTPASKAQPEAKPAQPETKPAPPEATPAQPATQPAPPASSGQGTAAPTNAVVEPPAFTYDPEGRRDPFLSLVRRGVDPRSEGQATRPSGLAGLSVAEVTLRGTVRSREGFVAIFQGADRRAYIVRPGDKLFDGTVHAVTQNDVMILQQVNDPLSLEKQREVRKMLRQPEAN
jgi:Tfp pilus assembly protein PilP